MGGMIPLGDASRRPARAPVVTILIILVNAFVFVQELIGGDAFVMNWSAIPDQIVSGHRLITLLTAMFMHASWSHIIGNMIFLWAFAPEIEDAMGPRPVSGFLYRGRAGGDDGPNRGLTTFHNSKPGCKRRDCRGHGRVLGYLSSRPYSRGSYSFLYSCGSHSFRLHS